MQLRGAIYGLTAAAIWGGMYVVSDRVLVVIPPFTLLTMRLVIGIIVLGLMLRKKAMVPRRDVLQLLAVGIIGFGISLGMQFVGTHDAGALNGSVVTSASPVFILLFAWWLLHETLTPTRIASVGLATIGVLIILDLSHFDLSSQTFVGNLALTIAALTWGLYSVLVRQISTRHETTVLTFYALSGGLIITIPATALEMSRTPLDLSTITPWIIAGILYLGVISTALAMVLWNRAFALVEASVASLFFFAQPLVGVLLSTTLLHQPLTPQLIIGGTLIILGVLLSMQRSTVQEAVTETP